MFPSACQLFYVLNYMKFLHTERGFFFGYGKGRYALYFCGKTWYNHGA